MNFFLLSTFTHLPLLHTAPLSNETTNSSSNILEPVRDAFNTYLVGPVTVGTPTNGTNEQILKRVIFTLASGDFWVQDAVASKAKRCQYPANVDAFNSNKSATFYNTTQTFSTNTTVQSVRGRVGIDRVQFFNLASNATFGVATEFDCWFIEHSVSGVLGLGWPQMNVSSPGNESIIQTARNNSKLPQFFTLLIDKKSQQGSITFGDSNKKQCNQQWRHTPVVKRGFWQVELENISTGPNSSFSLNVTHENNATNVSQNATIFTQHANATNATNQNAILLESMLMILGPLDAINYLIKQFGPSAGYSNISLSIVVLRSDFEQNKLPPVALKLRGGVEVTFEPKDYVLDTVPGTYLSTYFGLLSDYTKIAKVVPGNNLSGIDWVLGQPLMSKYCTLYNFGNETVSDPPSVGFALAKQ